MVIYEVETAHGGAEFHSFEDMLSAVYLIWQYQFDSIQMDEWNIVMADIKMTLEKSGIWEQYPLTIKKAGEEA